MKIRNWQSMLRPDATLRVGQDADRKRLHSLMVVVPILIGMSVLFSFSAVPGGDSFTIFLNDKLVLEHYVHSDEKPKNITLDPASSDGYLRIHYSHCGRMGITRNIMIKDAQKVLKEWHFPDSPDGSAKAMACKVGDILAIQKASGKKTLDIYYASKQLPKGYLLTSIEFSNQAKASLK